MKNGSIALLAICSILSGGFAAGLSAEEQPGPDDAQGLAKALSNPVADLISVPFQANWDFGVGTEGDTRSIINFQPVMPFSINEKWNLIQRVIVPLISQPVLSPGGEAASGIGDILASSFFSPKNSKRATWGVGPAMQLPISSEPTLGTEKWSLGPTFVILKQSGSWTYGALANHLWSIDGDETRRDVNQTFLQPFVAHSTRAGVTYTLNSESVADWEAASGEEWTVPIIGQVSKVTRLGRRPISVGAGAGYYAETPFDDGPEWRLRLVMALLFPAK